MKSDYYQGHLPDGSSVQAHSAGGLYPFVIYAQGADALTWGYIAPGATGKLVGTYDQACTQASLARDAANLARDLTLRAEAWQAFAASRNSVFSDAVKVDA